MNNNSHGNLVGSVVLKDIYIIKNRVNDKVYIGQAIDSYDRWKHHKTAAKTGHYKHRCLLYEAMQKYGIHNFYYEILESQIANYNERERYWISFYNSVVPNGYNLLEGGEQYPNLKGIMNSGSAIQNKETLDQVINDLLNSDLRLTDLAKKYDVPLNTIHGINSGDTYYNSSLAYPIRKSPVPVKFSDNDVIKIIDLLQGKDYMIAEIANMYNVSEETINCINIGKTRSAIMPDIDRPIRKKPIYKSDVLSDAEITEVIWLLKNTSLSLREIGKKFGVGHRVIINVKNGTKRYRRNGYDYPLRPNN